MISVSKELLVLCIGLIARRIEWHFLRRFIHARPHFGDALMYLIWQRFKEYPGYKQISMGLFYGPGYSSVDNQQICWETPLGFAVWDQEGPVLGLGIEFRHGFLCIRQLQGVPGKRIPTEYGSWPRLFVEAAKEFAVAAGLRGVRIYRAHASHFFWYPNIDLSALGNLDAVADDLRQRMRRRYDGTARQMGFVLKKDYGEWLCLPQAPGPS